MIRPVNFLIPFFLVIGLLAGCQKEEPHFYFDGQGKKPVYLPLNQLRDIKTEAPQSIGLSGTIFLQDTFLFILEQRKGIHLYSIADTLNTLNLAFFKIPAVTDFTVSGNLIYADNWRDLVVIDFSDPQHIVEKSRIENVISPALYPPLYDGAFECVDESQGAVIDWVDADLENAACRTIR